ncbi:MULTISPECIES: CHAT domain-containing protein [unclassified Rathayibacter]|uniref:CHAT domain-containing protein n=1 Tax=unclassified Rathayibacter TaxID=2609250 RepID=UPI0015E2AD7A|nr:MULTISPECIES: CHAT domain-containing protein [unclassified Rathayibacter]
MSRPTLFLAGVDRGRTYVFWQWIEPEPGEPEYHVMDPEQLDPLTNRIAAAVPDGSSAEEITAPSPLPQADRGIEETLRRGEFATLADELALARDLAALLLPAELARQLADAFVRNRRQPILFRVFPAASCSLVPWELLTLVVEDDDGVLRERRLIEVADVVYEVPAGMHVGRAARPRPWESSGDESRVVYVIDPVTRVASDVFDDHAAGRLAARAQRMPRRWQSLEHRGGADGWTRESLSTVLRDAQPPQRLVFVGHVVTVADGPGATALLLSDTAESYGVASVIRALDRGFVERNRPLSALDLLEGTSSIGARLPVLLQAEPDLAASTMRWPTGRRSNESGATIWPAPPRVLLLACSSGGDLRTPEPFGLALAFVNSGAAYVTATKWTIPTDHAFRLAYATDERYAALAIEPMVETALALDDAHTAEDPVAAIAQWQRGRLELWSSGTDPVGSSPLHWAAVSTYIGIERAVTPLVDGTSTRS